MAINGIEAHNWQSSYLNIQTTIGNLLLKNVFFLFYEAPKIGATHNERKQTFNRFLLCFIRVLNTI